MSDSITQMRLSMRLERYQRERTGKSVSRDSYSREMWETAWQIADKENPLQAMSFQSVVRRVCRGLSHKPMCSLPLLRFDLSPDRFNTHVSRRAGIIAVYPHGRPETPNGRASSVPAPAGRRTHRSPAPVERGRVCRGVGSARRGSWMDASRTLVCCYLW